MLTLPTNRVAVSTIHALDIFRPLQPSARQHPHDCGYGDDGDDAKHDPERATLDEAMTRSVKVVAGTRDQRCLHLDFAFL